MALLERESSLAALTQYAAEARQGDGRLVLVAGEAGAGKSTLVEEFQRGLPDAAWAWGACDGLSTPRPLGPLFDVAAALGGEILDLCRGGADRERLFDAVLRGLDRPGALAAVVIEDVHWADDATLDLLRFLGRRIRSVPALLLVTYRDDELAPADPLRLVLGELATHRSTRRIGLAPLSAQAVATMAGDGGPEPGELYRLTAGNPFYVTEVLRSGTRELPPSARDAALARAARLGPAARDVLDAAALLGPRPELPVLRAVVDCPAVVLDELLASGLLASGAPTEDGPALRFRHEIARLAVEELVPAHRRGGIHAGVLEALRAAGVDDDARLAFHAEAAGSGPGVLRHAPAAARRAVEFGSHREAVAQFERALRFAGRAPAPDVAEFCAELAAEAALLDRWQVAADASERAAGLWRDLGEPVREGEATRQLSLALCGLCRGADSQAAARAAVAILEPLGPTVELARAYAMLAAILMTGSHDGEAVRLARQARELATPLGALDVVSDALNTEGCSLAETDPGWRGLLERSLAIALEHGLRPQAGRAYANLNGVLCDGYRFAEAEPYFAAGSAYCDEHDLDHYGRFLRATRTLALLHRGEWDATLAACRQLLERADTSPLNRICPSVRIGAVLARRGQPEAWPHLDEAAAAADGTGEVQFVVPARLVRAEARWLDGDLAGAREEAERAADIAGSADSWLRGETAVWLRRTGSTRTVAGPVAEPWQCQLDGDPRRAAELWTERGCGYEAALALADATDEPALREALSVLDGLGAVATARVVRRRMRRLGVRSVPAGPRRATRNHPLGLTERERQVLDLLCTGSSNAQIAARLVIATKTVDHHVSAVLAKLGTPTRAEASAEAVRRGLVEASTVDRSSTLTG